MNVLYHCTNVIWNACIKKKKTKEIKSVATATNPLNFDILAQDQHIKPSLTQLIDQILEKLVLTHIKGS